MGLRLVHSMVSESTAAYSTSAASAKLNTRAREIHERALRRAENFRVSEADVIDSLREVEDEKLYLRFELTSIYKYAIKVMKLSEDIACNLIAIMRKSRTIPELAAKIRDGSITASKARKVVSVINHANKDAWLELASTATSRVIEKAVATENPKAAVQESIRYKTTDRLEFTIGVSEEWIDLLRDVKDLLSQEKQCAFSSEDALKYVMENYIDLRDPLRRAERSVARRDKKGSKKSEFGEGASRIARFETDAVVSDLKQESKQTVESSARFSVPGRITPHLRKRVPAATKNAVMLRDRRQCCHVMMDGSRCEQRRWLDVHHVIPVAKGGTNALDNLTTLCSSHHSMHHCH